MSKSRGQLGGACPNVSPIHRELAHGNPRKGQACFVAFALEKKENHHKHSITGAFTELSLSLERPPGEAAAQKVTLVSEQVKTKQLCGMSVTKTGVRTPVEGLVEESFRHWTICHDLT